MEREARGSGESTTLYNEIFPFLGDTLSAKEEIDNLESTDVFKVCCFLDACSLID